MLTFTIEVVVSLDFPPLIVGFVFFVFFVFFVVIVGYLFVVVVVVDFIVADLVSAEVSL